jgi:hypothetical protein
MNEIVKNLYNMFLRPARYTVADVDQQETVWIISYHAFEIGDAQYCVKPFKELMAHEVNLGRCNMAENETVRVYSKYWKPKRIIDQRCIVK